MNHQPGRCVVSEEGRERPGPAIGDRLPARDRQPLRRGRVAADGAEPRGARRVQRRAVRLLFHLRARGRPAGAARLEGAARRTSSIASSCAWARGITGWVAEHRQPVAVGLPRLRGSAVPDVQRVARGSLRGVSLGAGAVPRTAGRASSTCSIASRTSTAGRRFSWSRRLGSWSAPKSSWRGWRARTAQLSERLETRKVVERAKGILQRDLGISEQDAYLAIQRQSRHRRRPKREIAEAILLADDLRQGHS